MGFSPRRWRAVALIAITTTFGIYHFTSSSREWAQEIPAHNDIGADGKLHWAKLPERYPVETFIPLPTGKPVAIPAVQAKAPTLDTSAEAIRKKRLAAVKESFAHSWAGYKSHAWLQDEVIPIKGGAKNTFGGWAATLVDGLDSLWIMGMKEEFEEAVKSLDQLDFTYTDELSINVFETTIRYLGGFLATYDISEQAYPVLLTKAVEVAELLMCAFDTPNRMPIPRWTWRTYMAGDAQMAPQNLVVAELGSLSLEFTRLTQLTNDPKYYDAIQRISDVLEKHQSKTRLPGMWPIAVDAKTPSFDRHSGFTLGAMSDSVYEYLPKQYLLLGGLLEQPKKMYEAFIPIAKEHLFFRPLNPGNLDLLVSGELKSYSRSSQPSLTTEGQHLTCFAGGMVGLAAKIFNRPDELAIAERLTDGCVWAYDSQPSGIAPEVYSLVACNTTAIPSCDWSDAAWHGAISNLPADPLLATQSILTHRLSPGFTAYPNRKYILRPEAIESVFIMYRLTGDTAWMDKGWRMFEAVERACRTKIAASAVADVTAAKPVQTDSMESFWLAETLKYFYLLFSEWDVVSLDEWVLNTEAHPFRRPV